jgi:RND superfamily putative drug exporter
MFARLGDFVTKRWLPVVLVWAVLAIALRLMAPAWDSIAHDGNMAYLPADMTSVAGDQLLRDAFASNRAQSQVILVVAREDGPLTDPDQDVAVELGQRFSHLQYELGILDIWTPDLPVIGEKLHSEDDRAELIALQMRGEFMAVENIRILNRVNQILDEVRNADDFPQGLSVGVTGSAAVGGDMLASASESVRNTEWTTVLVIVAILLLVYRAPMLVIAPLFTIAISVAVGSSLLAILTQLHRIPGLGWWDFKVFTTTRIFIVVILFGSGTDFCLFLIARYREELAGGKPQREALAAALAGVGEALVGSAATTILGLAMMFFADFGKFRDSGPAIAICLAVTLAACLTLAPALLQAARRWVFWPVGLSPSGEPPDARTFSNRSSAFAEFWQRAGQFVVRRPGLLLAASILVLAPLAVAGASVEISYDLVNEMRADRPSVAGSRLLREHFPAGETGPVTVLVHRPGIDFRTAEARPHIVSLTRGFLDVEGVETVRSRTQPFGEKLSAVSLFTGDASKLLAAHTSRAKEIYVSPAPDFEGSVARFDLILDKDPFSREAAALLNSIEDEVRKLQQPDESPWHEASFYFTGTTAATRDLALVTTSDQVRIERLVVLAVLGVLLILLRQPAVCFYLILSVLFSYYVTLGATELAFQWIYAGSYTGLDWKVPLFLFVILVAVGEDYNIYLMTRVIEEQQRHGPIRGLQLAVARTGGIITSCGIIMAATFISMTTGTLRGMQELGFALSLGVLLDTLVVRTVLVPAFLTLLDRLTWVRAAKEHWQDVRPSLPGAAHGSSKSGQP